MPGGGDRFGREVVRMKLAQTREARALALAAVARGLIHPDVLWDMACRLTLGGVSSVRELFDGILTPEQIAQLADEPSASGPAAAPEAAPAAGAEAEPGSDADSPGLPSPVARAIEAGAGRYEFGNSLGIGGAGRVV